MLEQKSFLLLVFINIYLTMKCMLINLSLSYQKTVKRELPYLLYVIKK